MTYVMSDIHGNYHAFKKMLEQINFSDKDLLYIAGDLVDYGEEGMELLCDVSMRENVYSIVGDHDFEALKMLTKFEKILKHIKSNEYKMVFDSPTQISVDGEIITVKEIAMSCVKNAIKFVVPQGIDVQALGLKSEKDAVLV